MADNNLFIGKWLPVTDVEVPDEDVQKQVVQFYKDGSCLIPAALLGKEDSGYPMFYFYQVFENGMMKLESGEPTMNLYHCAMVGDQLTLTAMDGSAFTFIKVREAKRSFFRSKTADAAPAGDKALEPDQEPVTESEPEPGREPEEHEWKCPSCGKINQNYVGTCGCGAPKPNDKLFNWREVHPELIPQEPEEPVVTVEPEEEKKPKKPEIPEREPEEYEWKCPNCGKINQNYVGTCGCGEKKPNDKLFNWREVHPELIPQEPEEQVIAVEPEKPEKSKKSEKPAEPEKEPGPNEWKCPGCGKINQNYVGTCGCGERKPAHVGPYIPSPEVLAQMKPEETVTVSTDAAEADKPSDEK